MLERLKLTQKDALNQFADIQSYLVMVKRIHTGAILQFHFVPVNDNTNWIADIVNGVLFNYLVSATMSNMYYIASVHSVVDTMLIPQNLQSVDYQSQINIINSDHPDFDFFSPKIESDPKLLQPPFEIYQEMYLSSYLSTGPLPAGYSDYMERSMSLSFHHSLQSYYLDLWLMHNSFAGVYEATSSGWLYQISAFDVVNMPIRSCVVRHWLYKLLTNNEWLFLTGPIS